VPTLLSTREIRKRDETGGRRRRKRVCVRERKRKKRREEKSVCNMERDNLKMKLKS